MALRLVVLVLAFLKLFSNVKRAAKVIFFVRLFLTKRRREVPAKHTPQPEVFHPLISVLFCHKLDGNLWICNDAAFKVNKNNK